MSEPPFLYLAPIRGITDSLFRSLFQRHFGGVDAAVAPFLNPQPHANIEIRQIRDLLPEYNRELPVVPQFLHTDPEGLIALAHRLHDLGYTHINWNLGCPAPMVTRKRRGSGLLPYPDAIIAFLDTVVPRLPLQLSIKTRLGLNHPDELAALLPRLAGYPLKEIIIHARLGKQLYKGSTDPAGFSRCLEISRHPVIYNGDITGVDGFDALRRQFPAVRGWMIGRGLLADPFLAATIRGRLFGGGERHAMLSAFHQELFTAYQELLAGPSHLLGRMKQIWAYLAASFPESPKLWKKVKKAETIERYLDTVNEVLAPAIPVSTNLSPATTASARQ